MTRTLTETAVRTLHADYARKGSGFAPPVHETLAAARAGRLWAVDTQGAGCDCLAIGPDARDVVTDVATHYDADACAAHPDGAEGYAHDAGWTADPVTLACDCDADPTTCPCDGCAACGHYGIDRPRPVTPDAAYAAWERARDALLAADAAWMADPERERVTDASEALLGRAYLAAVRAEANALWAYRRANGEVSGDE